MPGLPMHAWGQGSGAQWHSHVLSASSGAKAVAHSSSSSDGGSGGAAEGGVVSNTHLPFKSLFLDAGIKVRAVGCCGDTGAMEAHFTTAAGAGMVTTRVKEVQVCIP